MKKILLFLLPLLLVCLGGCAKEFNYICEYEWWEVVWLVKNPIESDTHICSMFSWSIECFDRELCEEVQ